MKLIIHPVSRSGCLFYNDIVFIVFALVSLVLVRCNKPEFCFVVVVRFISGLTGIQWIFMCNARILYHYIIGVRIIITNARIVFICFLPCCTSLILVPSGIYGVYCSGVRTFRRGIATLNSNNFPIISGSISIFKDCRLVGINDSVGSFHFVYDIVVFTRIELCRLLTKLRWP